MTITLSLTLFIGFRETCLTANSDWHHFFPTRSMKWELTNGHIAAVVISACDYSLKFTINTDFESWKAENKFSESVFQNFWQAIHHSRGRIL